MAREKSSSARSAAMRVHPWASLPPIPRISSVDLAQRKRTATYSRIRAGCATKARPTTRNLGPRAVEAAGRTVSLAGRAANAKSEQERFVRPPHGPSQHVRYVNCRVCRARDRSQGRAHGASIKPGQYFKWMLTGRDRGRQRCAALLKTGAAPRFSARVRKII